jgi:uncharacterized protein (TIRG00374 family)
MKLSSFIPLIVSAIIIVIAASQLQIDKLWGALIQVDPIFLLAGLALWVGIVLLKTTKWMLVVRAMNGRVTAASSFEALMVGLFVGVMTPGRIGDFVRAAYVKDQLSWGKGIMAVVLDRAMDILSLLVLGLIGIIGISQFANMTIISSTQAGILLLMAVIGTYIALNKRVMKKTIYPLLMRFVPANMAQLLTRVGKEFYGSVPLLKQNVGFIVAAGIMTIISWFFSITFGFVIMQGLHLPVEWMVALLAVPVLALVEILPVSVVGIGTRELAAIIILGVFDVAPEQAVVFSLLYFILGYVPSFILGAIIFNLRPLPFAGGIDGIKKTIFKSEK